MTSRREFMRDAAIAGAVSAFGINSSVFAAEPALETTRIRLPKVANVCWAPAYIAENLLLELRKNTPVGAPGDDFFDFNCPARNSSGADQRDTRLTGRPVGIPDYAIDCCSWPFSVFSVTCG